MNSEETEYYRRRAEQERAAARDASKQYIAALHLDLAQSYEALLEHPELRHELRMVG